MELFQTECENRDFVLEMLKKKLFEQNNSFKDTKWNFMIDKEVPVPYRHIYFPVKNELEICCFKQDICIYTKLYDKSIDQREAAITVCDEEIIKVVLNKNAAKEKDIGLPFVIIETKMSKNIETHNILAYSEKTKMIKSIFPYCKAYLLCFGDSRRIVYRNGSGFDGFFSLENLDDDKCMRVINEISYSFSNTEWNMIATV
jgi:hypothetical protein